MTEQQLEEKSDILEESQETDCFMLDDDDDDEIPTEHINTFKPIPVYQQEAAMNKPIQVMDDKRKLIEPNDTSFLSRVGHLSLGFGRDKFYCGTGTVFALNEKNNTFFAVTCAHNCILYKPTKNIKLKKGRFNRRKVKSDNNKESEIIASYKVVNYWIHPKYEPSRQTSEYDVAILECKNGDNYFKLSK